MGSAWMGLRAVAMGSTSAVAGTPTVLGGTELPLLFALTGNLEGVVSPGYSA